MVSAGKDARRESKRTFPRLPQRRKLCRLVVRLLPTSREGDMTRPLAVGEARGVSKQFVRNQYLQASSRQTHSLARVARLM